MTEPATYPAYESIAARIGAVRRRYRLRLLVRGLMLWLAWAYVTWVAAAFAAHFLGQGPPVIVIAGLWIAWVAFSALFWIAIPLFKPLRPVQIARLIEQKFADLNNGLTNSLLLARSADLQTNPFVPRIYDEVLHDIQDKPLKNAVRFWNLRHLAINLLIWILGAIIVAQLFGVEFRHGWNQMLAPNRFIPQVGTVQILSVQPGNVTLVAGQDLQIVVKASAPRTPPPQGRLIVENNPVVLLAQHSLADSSLRYDHEIDHVDQSLRYRVEVGSTQSEWYAVTVLPEAQLLGMSLLVQPPAYTKQLPSVVHGAGPFTFPQGSDLKLSVDFSPPSGGHGSVTSKLTGDETLSVSILQGRETIAKLPEPPVVVHAQIDQPPSIHVVWPDRANLILPPTNDLTVEADLSDDWGLTAGRVLLGAGNSPSVVIAEAAPSDFASQPNVYHLQIPVHLPDEDCRDGSTIQLQIEAVDNRDLRATIPDGGPQSARSSIYRITFAAPDRITADSAARAEKLRKILTLMRADQQRYIDSVVQGAPMPSINAGQTALRNRMIDVAARFEFDADTQIVQRTLQMLAADPAQQAVDLSAAIIIEPVESERTTLIARLADQQRLILSSLDSLLGMITPAAPPATEPSRGNAPLLSKADAYRHLDDALKKFLEAQRKTLDQTASLAKIPSENFDDAQKDQLSKVRLQQDNLASFAQEMLSTFSSEGPQDMAHAHMVKDLIPIVKQIQLAKDAMKTPDMELAVPLDESAMGMGKEIKNSLDKWLADRPDRMHFQMEDPLGSADVPLPPLPKDLQDLMGKLLADQQDLFNQMRDQDANWRDAAAIGAAHRGADGGISDNSATGITGNVLPKNNDQQGRSAEGRNGKSEGEYVGDTYQGKGGRDTPTRLDPTPFQKGQVQDKSNQSAGGATGGGKLAGEGVSGLQGTAPVIPQSLYDQLHRLTQQQAGIRNTAEHLNLENNLIRYDNFKLEQAVLLMGRIESDLKANRYDNALASQNELLNDLQTSRLLLGSQIAVQEDQTPQPTDKLQQEINDVMRGQLPPAWSQPLTEYYRQLSSQ